MEKGAKLWYHKKTFFIMRLEEPQFKNCSILEKSPSEWDGKYGI